MFPNHLPFILHGALMGAKNFEHTHELINMIHTNKPNNDPYYVSQFMARPFA